MYVESVLNASPILLPSRQLLWYSGHSFIGFNDVEEDYEEP
jgi:hypothetical protein